MSSNDVVQRIFESLLVQARSKKVRNAFGRRHGARMSRSSMYRFHPGVVAQIQALSGAREAKRQDQYRLKAQQLTAQLKSEKGLSNALARACAELAAVRIAMREQFEEERLSFQLRVEHLEKQVRGGNAVGLLHVK